MNVGRSHIAATVNTLVLAYVGASLPLIVLFAAGRQDPLLIVSGEVVAVEVVRALVGSIGIVAAVPITTAIAVGLIGRRLPFIGEGTRHPARARLGLRADADSPPDPRLAQAGHRPGRSRTARRPGPPRRAARPHPTPTAADRHRRGRSSWAGAPPPPVPPPASPSPPAA